MSSDRDPPVSVGRSQQPRTGSGYVTTSKSAFRRPPPPGTSEQQFSQSTTHTEPIRSGLVSSRPTYVGPKHSRLSFKSTTTTPIASGSKSTTQFRNSPARSQERSQYHRTKSFRFSFPPSTKTSRTINLSGRISSQSHVPPSHAFRRPPAPVLAANLGNIMTTKTSQTLAPLWHELDDAYEERLRVKRRREEAGNYTAKRIAGRQTSAKSNNDTVDVEDPDRPKANIRPNLRINAIHQTDGSDSDHDESRYRPRAKLRSPKTIRPQIAPKAARKVNYVNTSSNDEDSDEEKGTGTSSSSSEKDQLDSDQYDVNMDEPPLPLRARTPPKIMILDSPPRITIPLPQIDLDLVNAPTPSTEPPDGLITALESLTLSTLRMQKTHQLPFLPRNLRTGFLSRCRVLGVPIYSDNRKLSLCVRYDYVAGLTYKTDISQWLCPLCELHGTFRTREMLDCHLRWDHAEVFSEWGQMDDTEGSESWNLQLLIPEPEIQAKTEDERDSLSVSQTPAPPVDRKAQFSNTPETNTSRNTYSLFPYVSTSPPSTRESTTSTPTSHRTPSMAVETKNIARLDKLKIQEEDSDLPSRSVSLSNRSTSQSTSTRSSNTRTSISTARTSTTVKPDRPSRYPAPPPPDNLLGPAAQPPYLPAKSEYGGPTVYHSYRPGGPCLFDLLNTLPLDPFGVLDWEILDREEEIYESDDVKEEYKVMHALWARWIMLNRNKFIANYFKGIIAFIDEYWKIIHQAAGWDALRYWLLMLLSNHFLTGHEVAKALVHYEDHTGMAFW